MNPPSSTHLIVPISCSSQDPSLPTYAFLPRCGVLARSFLGALSATLKCGAVDGNIDNGTVGESASFSVAGRHKWLRLLRAPLDPVMGISIVPPGMYIDQNGPFEEIPLQNFRLTVHAPRCSAARSVVITADVSSAVGVQIVTERIPFSVILKIAAGARTDLPYAPFTDECIESLAALAEHIGVCEKALSERILVVHQILLGCGVEAVLPGAEPDALSARATSAARQINAEGIHAQIRFLSDYDYSMIVHHLRSCIPSSSHPDDGGFSSEPPPFSPDVEDGGDTQY